MSRAEAEDLLSRLESLGVRLSKELDRLRVVAPPGTLTPELRLDLAEHRDTLLTLLHGAFDREPPRGGATSGPAAETTPAPSPPADAPEPRPNAVLDVAPPAPLPVPDDAGAIVRPVYFHDADDLHRIF